MICQTWRLKSSVLYFYIVPGVHPIFEESIVKKSTGWSSVRTATLRLPPILGLSLIVVLAAGYRMRAQDAAEIAANADVEIINAPAFSATDLAALPTDGWVTNGGNLFNQRYSPLTQIGPRQRVGASGRLADASGCFRRRRSLFGGGRAHRPRRRRVYRHRR